MPYENYFGRGTELTSECENENERDSPYLTHK